jgi:hypothetical protein
MLSDHSDAKMCDRMPPQIEQDIRENVLAWAWQQTLGRTDGSSGVLPIGALPPKAGLCTVLFNPIYKFIFIKNTKVAGTSVFLNFGGMCKTGTTLAIANVRLSSRTHALNHGVYAVQRPWCTSNEIHAVLRSMPAYLTHLCSCIYSIVAPVLGIDFKAFGGGVADQPNPQASQRPGEKSV